MTKEERAQIAKTNGAKSRGPISEDGKAKSARNALKSGDYAQQLDLFIPPHSAVTCNEDRQAYFALVDQLLEIYNPVNQLTANVVKQIARARWQIERLHNCLTAQWNAAIIASAKLPAKLVPELATIEVMADTATALYSNPATTQRLNREIDQLERRITHLERRLKFDHANFPTVADQNTQSVENTTNPQGNEPPVFTTENNPEVIAAYKTLFPNRKIVILPPDNVAKGIDLADDMPPAPRKAG